MEDAPTYAQYPTETVAAQYPTETVAAQYPTETVAAPPLTGVAGEGATPFDAEAFNRRVRQRTDEERVGFYDRTIQPGGDKNMTVNIARSMVQANRPKHEPYLSMIQSLVEAYDAELAEATTLRARLQEETRAAAEQRMLADAMRENLESYRLLLPKADERYAAEVAAHAETSAAYTGALKEWKEAAGNADRLLRERNAARQEAAEAEREKLALHEELRGLRAGLQEIRTRLSFADAPKWLRDKLRADLLELIEPKSEGVGPLVGGEGKEGQIAGTGWCARCTAPVFGGGTHCSTCASITKTKAREI